jgi:hypothetical protein
MIKTPFGVVLQPPPVEPAGTAIDFCLPIRSILNILNKIVKDYIRKIYKV